MVRIKHRYVVGQVWLDSNNEGTKMTVNHREILGQIKDKIQLLFGDVGSGSFGLNLSIKYYERDLMHLFVLRCPRESETEVKLAMSSVTAIRSEGAIIRCIDTCGSVRTCMVRLREIIDSVSGAFGITSEEAISGFYKRIEEFENNS